MKHLRLGVVEDLVAGRLAGAERRRAVRHLLTGCKLCGGRLAAAAPDLFFGANPRGEDYDAAIDRAAAKAGELLGRWRTDRERLVHCLELIRKCPQGYDGLSFEQV